MVDDWYRCIRSGIGTEKTVYENARLSGSLHDDLPEYSYQIAWGCSIS